MPRNADTSRESFMAGYAAHKLATIGALKDLKLWQAISALSSTRGLGSSMRAVTAAGSGEFSADPGFGIVAIMSNAALRIATSGELRAELNRVSSEASRPRSARAHKAWIRPYGDAALE